MKKYKFTIITPVYNRERSIGRCIESVLGQNYQNFECIVIDDGSTDGTKHLIEKYSHRDNRIIQVRLPENKGVNFARNRGIEKTEGDFIIFLDSDDWFVDNALEEINCEINKNKGYSHYLFNVSDRITDNSLPETNTIIHYEDVLTEKISGDFTHVIKPSCFAAKPFFEQFNGYESLNWLRVIKENQPILFINKIIEERDRESQDSLSRNLYSHSIDKIREKHARGLIYFRLYGKDLSLNKCIPTKKLARTVLFGKIIHKPDAKLSNLLKKHNWFVWFLILLLPAIFLEKLIILNAKRKLK